MSRNRYLVLCALVLTGAFAGGFAANRTMPVAHAQERVPAPPMRASGFTVVDSQGKVQASLRSGTLGAELILDDANGHGRVEIGTSGIVIRDAMGRLVWSSPRGSGVVPAAEQP